MYVKLKNATCVKHAVVKSLIVLCQPTFMKALVAPQRVFDFFFASYRECFIEITFQILTEIRPFPLCADRVCVSTNHDKKNRDQMLACRVFLSQPNHDKNNHSQMGEVDTPSHHTILTASDVIVRLVVLKTSTCVATASRRKHPQLIHEVVVHQSYCVHEQRSAS